jgi:hypothetical protein
MPPVPDSDVSPSSSASYRRLDGEREVDDGRTADDGGGASSRKSLKGRLSDSLSSSSLSSLFRRPSNALAPPSASSSPLPPASSELLLLSDEDRPPSPSTSASAAPPSLPSFLSSPVLYVSALSGWLLSEWRVLVSAQWMALSYLYAETKRNYRGFLIGLFTVLLVVTVIALIQNNTLKSPIIFFKVTRAHHRTRHTRG